MNCHGIPQKIVCVHMCVGRREGSGSVRGDVIHMTVNNIFFYHRPSEL